MTIFEKYFLAAMGLQPTANQDVGTHHGASGVVIGCVRRARREILWVTLADGELASRAVEV